MQPSLKALSGGALILILVLAGCGGTSSKAASSAAQAAVTSSASSGSSATTATSPSTQTKTGTDAPAEPASHANISLSSSVFQAGRVIGHEERAIPARYTCDGSNISPPMRWSGVPASSAELILIVMDLNAPSPTRFFNWAIARLKPTLHGISAGRLPAGALVGRNGLEQRRYSVCPSKGRAHTYFVVLYALQQRLPLRPGFDANALYEKIGGSGLSQGQSGFVYKRR